MELTLAPPQLVGASNDSATHYWFPSNMAIAWPNALIIDARLADDCSDYFCNKTDTCKPSDPSHQVSLSTDGGMSFTPMWNVGGFSPWAPGIKSRPFVGSVTLALNDGFEGGGTTFSAPVGVTARPETGHAVAFRGNLRHGGAPVTAGTRYIVAAFLFTE